MFQKILIANRGEIACRVIKTARRLGIKTVAVYSDADAQALHVKMADEVVHIGPPPANQSYIVIDKIMDAIQQTGADAVHPGYGFLSENPKFADALDTAGVAFIGPPKGAIEAMGDKITSKKIAQDAGVSTVPGYMGLIEDADEAVKIAADIGYPVMIKASAGGGGKGMRIAWNEEETREGFQSSKNEAASSFGDDRIFIEKFVTQPRHIEIQVLCDAHGNGIYLGERECSIQRRNQKVIEEAPSPFLDEATRKAMGEQAVALAKAVGYTSAGTVEFIVDGERNFYFLEMNTRLQVEHPVTELITGVDLVEQMIKVAAGEKLSMAQSDVTLTGWAVESRLYAEDPYRNFLPSTGRLTRYRPPFECAAGPLDSDLWYDGQEVNEVERSQNGTAIRNDTGVYEGGEISIFYDPMIAKLCTWADSREAAIKAMQQALDQFEVEGIGHNLPFLSAVMDHPRFQSGNITTAFIEEEYPDGFAGAELNGALLQNVAFCAAVMQHTMERRKAGISGRLNAGQTEADAEYVVHMAGEQYGFEIAPHETGWSALPLPRWDHAELNLEGQWQPGQSLVHFMCNGDDIWLKVNPITGGFRLRLQGADLEAKVYRPHQARLADLMPEKEPVDTSKLLLCPMPGLVVSIAVEEGEPVKAGTVLAVVEAMKMENVLRAERDGTIAKINAKAGDSLPVDAVIMEFEG